ncbi:hypothetical protein RFI_19209 [Reticulomyxa filosa]|uniref:Uncharacterized protein n=1 Tax=Reticulomyxa filosa TaxID=46433 RepID=X6MW69_RETFI|nr:hypothetical protein RFI_19209 [Reticulomyxa filosa]|eukprot:ETO18079.1 hypothetical protein RFI_19209 [Reticulomyxa filosa]
MPEESNTVIDKDHKDHEEKTQVQTTYPKQKIIIIPDKVGFTCPYCWTETKSRKQMSGHMWNFSETVRKKPCSGKDCTELNIQPKLLLGDTLDNLQRDFESIEWDEIRHCLKSAKWDRLEEMEIKVSDALLEQAVTSGIWVPSDDDNMDSQKGGIW